MAAAWIWTIFNHGGPVQAAGESAHIKATRRQLISHLETAFEIINEEENMLISGTREMSAVADSAEPKQ